MIFNYNTYFKIFCCLQNNLNNTPTKLLSILCIRLRKHPLLINLEYCFAANCHNQAAGVKAKQCLTWSKLRTKSRLLRILNIGRELVECVSLELLAIEEPISAIVFCIECVSTYSVCNELCL